MDEAHESQEMPAVPLQYARVDAADALQAYRLVGTAMLLYYCGSIAGACVSAAGYYQVGFATWVNYIQQGVMALLGAVSLAGAVCMTRQLRVGAWLVVGVAVLQIGVKCVLLFAGALDMRSARPGIFLLSAGSVTISILQSAAIALLAYLFWDHCRKRGAWG